ncbi:MAG TPA: hypothetical protein VK076_10245 [Candidatus Sphingobacterium stercoripullorum]|nr:hypothetical protein [Candidatus Sphingobacterium stercoripullorum]
MMPRLLTVRYADQNNCFLDYTDSRSVVLTLKYAFGNQRLGKGKEVKGAEEKGRI